MLCGCAAGEREVRKMNKKNIFLIILFFLCFSIYSLSPEEEYDFLIKDLYNYSTYGYKRTFDFDEDKTDGIINLSQGNIQTTNNYLDIAIRGKGYFKVKDKNGNSFYTRYGKLMYDSESCSLYILVNKTEYFLDFPILPKYYFVFDQIRILMDGSVECVIQENKNNTNENITHILSDIMKDKKGLGGKIVVDSGKFNKLEIIEQPKEKKEVIGEIILYDIDESNIDFYDGCLIKTKTSPDKISSSQFIAGALEMSNVYLDKVLIRMLFIIDKLDSDKIKHKEVKKYLIQKMLDPDFVRVKLFGYFYEEHPRMDDISGLKDYVHFLERNYE